MQGSFAQTQRHESMAIQRLRRYRALFRKYRSSFPEIQGSFAEMQGSFAKI